MKSNKVLVLSMAILILLASIPVYASTPVVTIETAEDLRQLSKDCVLDAYSRGVIVVIKNDIDLEGESFTPIPSFSGVFDGRGYTIKNLKIDEEGSHRALFRYLEVPGVIRHLNVQGIVETSGSKIEIGGVVGVNRGVITGVSFNGQVNGLTSVGGIVGLNEATGSILNSKAYGLITGEHYTGGIVGKNLGYVSACENHASVNTTDDTIKSNDMASYDLDKIDLSDTDSTEDVEAQTDTGGIAGYSRGILKGNINHGNVGYKHVGYNIGGIVGRHNGYIINNINYGSVYGRKDVGGVVGQMEPYVRLLFSEDTLQELDEALIDMNETVQQLIDDGYGSSKDISAQLEDVNQKMKKTSDDLEVLLNNTSSYADDAGETINEGFHRVKTVIIQLEYVVDEMKASTEDITLGLNHMKDGFDDLTQGSESLEDAIGDLQNAMYELDLAMENLDKALTKINLGLNLIGQAAETSDKYDQGMKLVLEGLDDLEQASIKANEAVSRIADYYNTNGNLIGFDYGPSFEALSQALDHLNLATPKLRNGFNLLNSEFQDDMDKVNEAFIWFDSANKDIEAMGQDLKVMKEYLDESIQHLEDGTEYISDAMRDFSSSSENLAQASKHMTQAFKYFDMILNEQQREPALKFPILSDYTKESSEAFFNDLSDLSLSITSLNQLMSSTSDVTYANLKQLNKDYEHVMEIIRQGINALSFDENAKFEDISDIDTDEVIEQGVTINCQNFGLIQGDVDVGGIAGAMAIEYDFDPEDDIVKKGNQSYNFKYQTKANLLYSRNEGKVISKKNYAGGIVGRMDLGLISHSENYSHVESSDGDYVGGIAGSSDGIIRNSYSISKLSGNKYIGGISGYARDIYDCFVMMSIDNCEEYAGSIAGDIIGEYKNNTFINNEWAGVDGISYAEKAKPEDYENISQYDLPKEFDQLNVTYIVDDTVLENRTVFYGDSLSFSDLPSLPVRDGYYGKWSVESIDYISFNQIIEAEYVPMKQVIASHEDKPVILVEGVFNPSDTLYVNASKSYHVDPGEILIDEYAVTVHAGDQDIKTFRVLKPEDDVKLYIKADDEWVCLEVEEDGSYLVFDHHSDNFHLALVSKPVKYNVLYILASVIVVILILLIVKKRRTIKSPA